MDNSEGRGQCEPFHRYSFPRLFPVGQKFGRAILVACLPLVFPKLLQCGRKRFLPLPAPDAFPAIFHIGQMEQLPQLINGPGPHCHPSYPKHVFTFIIVQVGEKQCFVLHLPKKGRSIQLDFQNLVGRDKRRQKTRPAAPIPYVQILSLVHVYALRPFLRLPKQQEEMALLPLAPMNPERSHVSQFSWTNGMERISQGKDGFNLKPIRKWSSSCRSLFDVRGFPSEPIFRRPYALPAPNSCQFPVPGPQASSRA